jgi:hypothetical protein
MNLPLEPVLVLLLPEVVDVPFLLVDELLLWVPFFTANADVTTLPLLEVVIRDIAAMIANMANPVVIIFFVCI